MTIPQRKRNWTHPAGDVWMKLKDNELLARLMKEHRYSQRRLARDAGFATHTYLGQLVRGEESTCTADRAVAIAALLRVPLDTLFVSNVSTVGARTAQQDDNDRSFRSSAGAA
jgi:transcriptional regulator with XRE-family HTH domain